MFRKLRPCYPVALISLFFICLCSPLALAAMEGETPDLTEYPAALIFDGNSLPLALPLMRDAGGHTYIALSECPAVLRCQAGWGEAEQILLANSSGSVKMNLYSTAYSANQLLKEMNCPPVMDSTGIVWVPLRPVAEALLYHLQYDSNLDAIILMSDAYFQQMQKTQPLPSILDVDTSKLGNWGKISGSAFAAYVDQPTLLEGYYTRLINSSAARTNNVSLSCNAVNETILQPNQIFSFNQVVGERTTAKGYQDAPIFMGKEVVPGVGGGICQTSTTLYNAALQSGLQIIERHPHSMPVAYAPSGYDATVSWGSADFRFKNTSGTPMHISCKIIKNYVVAVFSKI